MTDGFRTPKKLSSKQLTDQVTLLNARMDMLTNAASADIQRLNVLFFTFLKEVGKAEEIVCQKCEVANIRPLLEGIELDPRCVNCNSLIIPLPDEVFTDPAVMDSSPEDEES